MIIEGADLRVVTRAADGAEAVALVAALVAAETRRLRPRRARLTRDAHTGASG